MSENLRNYTRALFAMDAIVNRMPQAAWDNQSPCADWTARQVLGHSVWGINNLASIAAGAAPPAEQAEADVAGPRPWETWATARSNILRTLDSRGALQREFESPFGPTTVDGALGLFFADPLVHTWDIAQAGKIEAAIPEDLASGVVANLAAAGDAVRGPGFFGPARQVDDGASVIDQFVAITGRSWS